MTYDDLIERLRGERVHLLADIDIRLEAAQAIRDLQAENAKLREALEWYRGNVSWCNNFGREGTEARDRLAEDLGNKARAALEETPDKREAE